MGQVSFFLFAVLSFGQLNKCEVGEGILYTDKPCPAGSKQLASVEELYRSAHRKILDSASNDPWRVKLEAIQKQAAAERLPHELDLRECETRLANEAGNGVGVSYEAELRACIQIHSEQMAEINRRSQKSIDELFLEVLQQK
ncbi:MAG: hypothetical protein AAGA23_02390 [Pseudomonadota bacterium]